MTLRNWLGLRCLFNSCPGNIDHDKHSVFWRCAICEKMDRAPAIGEHWEPRTTSHWHRELIDREPDHGQYKVSDTNGTRESK